MLNKSMREREIWIDILKGMAIILVVVGHNTPPSEYANGYCRWQSVFPLQHLHDTLSHG